jgi:hypothetical protein
MPSSPHDPPRIGGCQLNNRDWLWRLHLAPPGRLAVAPPAGDFDARMGDDALKWPHPKGCGATLNVLHHIWGVPDATGQGRTIPPYPL